MADLNTDKARLVCVPLKITVVLEWWPTDVTRTLSSRNVSELERPDKRALMVPTSLTSDDYSIGYTMRTDDFRRSAWTGATPRAHGTGVGEHINDLEAIAKSKHPVQLLLGRNVEGLFRIESPSITILEWTKDGRPSVVDVSLTLRRASDAEVNVGLIKRVKGRGRGFAKKKG